MITNHKDLVEPTPESKLWRFMDLTKLLDLIQRKKLWFSRLDHLTDDPFEGKLSRLSGYIGEVKPGQSKEYDRIIEEFRKIYDEWRERLFVNCWHLNEYESAAFWNTYIKGDCGIAIQSTYKKLKQSINESKAKRIYSGKVKYVDYSKDVIPLNFFFRVAYYKSRSYCHENEHRLLIIEINEKNTGSSAGFHVPVDLDILIENIYVAPQVEDWKYEVIKNVVSINDLDKPVCHSTLDKVPY
jgi:hypothetical protein